MLFFAIGTPDSIETTCQAIRRATPCDARWYPDTYNPGLALLEVFAPGVSKAQGLLELKRITGADRVVAFGDNLNDMPMLLAADEAIVVDNAHPSVKAIATRIIPPTPPTPSSATSPPTSDKTTPACKNPPGRKGVYHN